MSDFHSLLSTFRAATGADDDGPPRSSKGAKQDTDAASDGRKPARSLLEATTELWRIAEIRRSTGISAARSAKHQQPPASSSRPAFHLAICACIVEDLPHEDVWRAFICGGGGRTGEGAAPPTETGAELYVHAKHPSRIRSRWVRSRTLDRSYRPDWNDVRVVRAMLALLAEALGDARTTHVLFCTESCLPVASLEEVARVVVGGEDDDLFYPQRSFVDMYGRGSPRATRFDERGCWDALQDAVPLDAVRKALPGWCLLSRRHARGVLDLPDRLGGQDLWPAFERVWAPEEVYFPTCLALLGFTSGDEVVRRPLTYAEWNERAKNHSDRAHPLTFDVSFDARLVRYVREEQGCLFLRKVKRSISVRRWEDSVDRARDRRWVCEDRAGKKRRRDNGDGGVDPQQEGSSSTSTTSRNIRHRL